MIMIKNNDVFVFNDNYGKIGNNNYNFTINHIINKTEIENQSLTKIQVNQKPTQSYNYCKMRQKSKPNQNPGQIYSKKSWKSTW